MILMRYVTLLDLTLGIDVTGGECARANQMVSILKPLPANKRRIRPTKFCDFKAENTTDRQATLNSPLQPTLNNVRTLFFVRTTTDWNHLSDDQVKAPTLEDFKLRIVTQSTTRLSSVHTTPVAPIPKIRSSDVSHPRSRSRHCCQPRWLLSTLSCLRVVYLACTKKLL